MKTTPFSKDFKVQKFYLTNDLYNFGYIILFDKPIIESIHIYINETHNIINKQYDIIEITEDNIDLYPNTVVGFYILSWENYSDIFLDFIDKLFHIKYITE